MFSAHTWVGINDGNIHAIRISVSSSYYIIAQLPVIRILFVSEKSWSKSH